MDKYVEILCKQNPQMTLECQNPECKHSIKINTKDFFQNNEYILTCSDCKKRNIFHTSKFANDFKKQLNEAGINLN